MVILGRSGMSGYALLVEVRVSAGARWTDHQRDRRKCQWQTTPRLALDRADYFRVLRSTMKPPGPRIKGPTEMTSDAVHIGNSKTGDYDCDTDLADL